MKPKVRLVRMTEDCYEVDRWSAILVGVGLPARCVIGMGDGHTHVFVN